MLVNGKLSVFVAFWILGGAPYHWVQCRSERWGRSCVPLVGRGGRGRRAPPPARWGSGWGGFGEPPPPPPPPPATTPPAPSGRGPPGQGLRGGWRRVPPGPRRQTEGAPPTPPTPQGQPPSATAPGSRGGSAGSGHARSTLQGSFNQLNLYSFKL